MAAGAYAPAAWAKHPLRLGDWVLAGLQRDAAEIDQGQIEVPSKLHPAYLRHLSRLTDRTLATELDGDKFVANRWSFGEVSVADQYLGSIADLYPGEPAYIDAWHDLRAVLTGMVGPAVVAEALDSNSGYCNNCLLTTWEEFQLYNGFLFAVLEGLHEHRNVFRLFGYLGERILGVYLALQEARRPGFTVQSRPMMLFV